MKKNMYFNVLFSLQQLDDQLTECLSQLLPTNIAISNNHGNLILLTLI